MAAETGPRNTAGDAPDPRRWEALERECALCRRCGLGAGRTNPVFGEGSRSARVMFIGEGPGQQEDLQGRPFVGPAGQLLDIMLEIMGLARSEVYIANIVKCRPPGNRDPLPDEQMACIGFLRQQIDLVNPRILVFLGRIAAQAFIRPDFRITREHGQWFRVLGRPAMALFHPAALLRDTGRRPETFEDLKRLQREIEKLT